MNKVLVKILVVLIAILLIECTFLNTKSHSFDFDDIITSGKNFLETDGDLSGDSSLQIDEQKMQETSKTIYNILFTIGGVISVGVGLVIGIQFILGSVDEKAKLKETLVPYVIGVFVIFSAFTIWKIAINIGNQIENQSETELSQKAKELITEGKKNGTIDNIENLTDEELMALYNEAQIYATIKSKMLQGSSLGEALESLNDYKRQIYYESLKRELISDQEIVFVSSRGGKCPYCGETIPSGQITDLERGKKIICTNLKCRKTISY